MYHVVRIANMEDSRHPDYRQCFAAQPDESSPYCAMVLPPNWKETGQRVPFYGKWIEAPTGTAAIQKMQNWLRG